MWRLQRDVIEVFPLQIHRPKRFGWRVMQHGNVTNSFIIICFRRHVVSYHVMWHPLTIICTRCQTSPVISWSSCSHSDLQSIILCLLSIYLWDCLCVLCVFILHIHLPVKCSPRSMVEYHGLMAYGHVTWLSGRSNHWCLL